VRTLSRYRCELTGWIVAWAVSVYASALVRALQTDPHAGRLAGLPGAVFDTADDVPPLAKLTLGAVLLALPLLSSRLSGGFAFRLALGAAGGLLAMAVALLLPVGYYPAPPGAWLAPHLFCGILGGALYAVVSDRCRRRLAISR
jgi:hypothetical protein